MLKSYDLFKCRRHCQNKILPLSHAPQRRMWHLHVFSSEYFLLCVKETKTLDEERFLFSKVCPQSLFIASKNNLDVDYFSHLSLPFTVEQPSDFQGYQGPSSVSWALGHSQVGGVDRP